MKRYVIALFIFLLMTCIYSTPLYATLIRTTVDSTFVVVDDVNNVQWADLNRFTNMNYAEVITEIGVMNSADFAGASDWDLANESELFDLLDEIVTVGDARQFDETWNPINTEEVIGRIDKLSPYGDSHYAGIWRYPIGADDSSTIFDAKGIAGPVYEDDLSDYWIGAFVVSSATASTPIPEPSTMLLFCTALMGLVGFKKKTKP